MKRGFDEDSIKNYLLEPGCLEDDVGVSQVNDELRIYSTIDTFVFSSDKPIFMPVSSSIYKAVVSSLSDIYVKGLKPISLGISIGFSKVSALTLRGVKLGLKMIIDRYGLPKCFKWDTNKSNDPFISVFSVALGPISIPSWSNAKPGMDIYVDGYFGLNKLGLMFLLGDLDPTEFVDIYRKSVNEFLYPSPELLKYPSLVRDCKVEASIDSSDGLARSLNILSRKSGVKIVIEKIPSHPLLSKLDSILDSYKLIDLVFYGGEEYKGIFVAKDLHEDTIKKYGLIRIGKIVKGQGVRLCDESSGVDIILQDKGYKHVFY